MEDGWFVVDLKKLYRIHYTFIYKMCEDCGEWGEGKGMRGEGGEGEGVKEGRGGG